MNLLGHEVKDATGSCDSFNAAFAVKLLEGASNEEALRFAGRAGFMASTKLGNSESMPLREDIDALKERFDPKPEEESDESFGKTESIEFLQLNTGDS